MNRKQERKEALYLIFEADFRPDETAEELLQSAADYRALAVTDYIRETLNGVIAHRAEIDPLISANLRGWTLKRISSVTLAVLRLAVYEMLWNDAVGESIAINEAVELTREFDADDMPAFVNGVLGSISRSGAKAPKGEPADEAASVAEDGAKTENETVSEADVSEKSSEEQ